MYENATTMFEGVRDRMFAVGKARGMGRTIEDVARASGLSRSTIHKFAYKDLRNPTMETLDKILVGVQAIEAQQAA